MCLKDGEALEELYGGKKIIQNKNLYRFTSDSILLSKFAKGKKDDICADFCAGCGVVGFHFLCMNEVKSMTLFEMQPCLADMAKRTNEINSFGCDVVCSRLQEIGAEYGNTFSLILCNPPYECGGVMPKDEHLASCKTERDITLEEICQISSKKLKPSGRLDIMNKASRLGELMYLLIKYNLQPKKMQFICGKEGQKPYLVMVEAVKGARMGLEILPPKINEEVSV